MSLKWSWVICGKLAKTCRNTGCSSLVREEKVHCWLCSCLSPCISCIFHYTLLPSLENHLQKKKKKMKGWWVSSKWFNFYPVCLQLSFVKKKKTITNMQHITVNLVLFKINFKCFYLNKDLILFWHLLPLCWWH